MPSSCRLRADVGNPEVMARMDWRLPATRSGSPDLGSQRMWIWRLLTRLHSVLVDGKRR